MVDFVLPVGADGEVQGHDHPDLDDSKRIIRRVSEDFIVPDGNGGSRISSALFKLDPKGGYLSADSESCILDRKMDPVAYVTTPKWIGSLVITVGNFRSIDKAAKAEDRWKIGMVPIKGNDCHAGVWGKITKGQSNDLQRLSDWLVQMRGVEKLEPAPS